MQLPMLLLFSPTAVLCAVLCAAPVALAPRIAVAQGAKQNDRASDPGTRGAEKGQSGAAAEKTVEDGKDSDEPARAARAAGADSVDIDALRREYLRLRDELFRSRARAAAVASALYSTKLRILLDYGSGRFYSVTRATIRLDGANIYDDTSGAIARDRAPRFEGYVAPGRHQINIRIEAAGKDDDRFTSIVDNTFTIQAPAGRDVVIAASARDGGDIAYQWKKRQNGAYKLSLDVSVATAPRARGAPAGTGQKQQKQPPRKQPRKKSQPKPQNKANNRRSGTIGRAAAARSGEETQYAQN
ncbi:MAG: hypothetical protein MJE77_30895 [Proteobacteria bacterium]|nr:hypothetical protein [Pseudomonadota bacterium]